MTTYEEIKTQIALELLEDAILETLKGEFCPEDYLSENDIARAIGIYPEIRSGDLVRFVLERLKRKGKIHQHTVDARRRYGWKLAYNQQAPTQ